MEEFYDVFAECATDPVLENEGVWRDVGKKGRIKVARANNRAYSKLLNRLASENQEVLDRKNPDGTATDEADAKSDQIMIECYARTILLGFEGLGYQGKPIEYSVDNAKKLLSHSEFMGLVSRKANEFDAYKAKQEVDQGNG